MEENKFKIVIDFVMVAIIFAFLLYGLIKVVFFDEEVNYYENRKANRLININGLTSFFTGDLQDKMELAFSDQIPFSNDMKRQYNFLKNTLIDEFQKNILNDKLKGRYASVGNGMYKILGYDYLLFDIENKEKNLPALNKRIEQINNVTEKMPDTKFVLYYIEKETDINFETREKKEFFEYIDENVNKSNLITKKFEVNSFDEYRKLFYKTDHHWNYDGSYKGYCELLSIISDEKPLIPVKKVIFNDKEFTGSKVVQLGTNGIYKELFEAYYFDIPQHTTYICGAKEEYGKEDWYVNTTHPYISYANFYGMDSGEVIFDFNNPQKKNVLLLGESYDNAIIKLVATHFNETYSVDLRNYEREMEKEFFLEKYVKENDIDIVILIGNLGYFTSEDFSLEN